MERICERCAGEDDDLVLVHPPPVAAAADATGTGTGTGTGELWCFECRSSVDHVTVDDA